MRALFGIASHFCEVVVLELFTFTRSELELLIRFQDLCAGVVKGKG